MERNLNHPNHLKYTCRSYHQQSTTVNTECGQRNGTVRCVWEGINGGDGIDVGDGSMLNNYLSHVEFANDQISQSVNMQSAEYDREHRE